MKTVKRALSLFLSVAMVVTGVNLGTLSKVQAAEIKNETYYREVTGTFYGTEGNQVSLGTSTELSAEGRRHVQHPLKVRHMMEVIRLTGEVQDMDVWYFRFQRIWILQICRAPA